MTRSIALIGPMAAGKTTLANALIEAHGFRRVSMIGAFRDLFGRAYPGVGKGDEVAVLPERLCLDPACDEKVHLVVEHLSGREVMQRFAPATRSVDSLFWTRIAFNDIQPLIDAGVPHVSDDVRYPTEADMARERDFLIVRIETPREVRLARYRDLYGRYPTEAEEAAPSEQQIALIEPDLTVSGVTDPNVTAATLAELAGSSAVRLTKES